MQNLLPDLSLTASRTNLRRLALVRLIATAMTAALITYAYFRPDLSFTYPVHLGLLGGLSLFTLLTYWRLSYPWPVTDLEYFSQLLIDLIFITALLAVSGSASNPFVSYYLVPISIGAALLPSAYTFCITALALLAYTAMLLNGAEGHHHGNMFAQHLVGMWMTFVLSAVLITTLVAKIAATLREQQAELNRRHEEELLNEQILAVATLAAGTAHELGTPLGSMTLLLDEMAHSAEAENLHSDIDLLKKQVAQCRGILQKLVSTARSGEAGKTENVDAEFYLRGILDRWQVFRPGCRFNFESSARDAIAIEVNSTLEQAIDNLLNNAVDADDRAIDVTLACEANEMVLTIRDYGAGIPLAIAEQIGRPFISNKHHGLGLGLFISHAAVNRLGGSIKLHTHPEGGTVSELRLPVAQKIT